MSEEKDKYWLDDYGSRYWYKNTDMSISAHRSYHWVDRVTFIHESSVHWIDDKNIWSTSDRHCNVGPDIRYTEFKNQLDDWTPIENFDEYAKELKDYLEYKKYNL